VFPGIITTTGGLTGTFSRIVAPAGPVMFWEPVYYANRCDLVAGGDFANPGVPLTANQRNVGLMLNGVYPGATGDLATVLNVLTQLPTAAFPDAYQQISADKAGALGNLGFAGANLQMRNLARRVTDLRFGTRERGAVGGLPGSLNLSYSRAAGLMLAFNSSSLAGLLTAKKEAPSETRWGLYLEPDVILGTQKSSINQTGYDFTIAGFTAGADYQVRENLLLGLATGYSHTDADFKASGGNVENNTWPLTAYAAYLPGSFYAYGSLGYALNLFDLERKIDFGGLSRTARGSPTGHQFNAYGEAGYDLKAQRLVVTPAVSLAYSRLWVDGFTEDGAGALNLKVPSQTAESL
jgi:outer membrane autotransporter protein